jgi:hypothetical protein
MKSDERSNGSWPRRACGPPRHGRHIAVINAVRAQFGEVQVRCSGDAGVVVEEALPHGPAR